MLGIEAAARRERYLTTRTHLAGLPFHRTLEQFEFGFQPSIDERQAKELESLAFVAEATNLLLLGPPSVGKPHLAVALAIKASEQGYEASLKWPCLGMCSGPPVADWNVSGGSMQYLGSDHPWGHRR